MIQQGSLRMYQGFCLGTFLVNSLLSNAKYIIVRNERRIYVLILVAMLLLLLFFAGADDNGDDDNHSGGGGGDYDDGDIGNKDNAAWVLG